MPTIKFTDRSIKALKAPASGRIDYWAADLPGFGVRVSDSGRKTWGVMYRAGGVQRRLTLGTYPAIGLASARKGARGTLHAVAHGKDPSAEKKAQRLAETVSELVELTITGAVVV